VIPLEELTGKIKELSLLPPTAARLSSVLASPTSTIDDCVDIVKFDQALTLMTLKQANSAYSGASREITDIRDAVIRLGGGRILRELLSRSLQGDLAPAVPTYGYSENELWRHSVAAASAAEALGSFIKLQSGGLTFSSALLHDIGKLILARMAPRSDMDSIWKKVTVDKCTCEAAERDILGFSHAEVGAAVVTAWGLPGPIAKSVRDHHALIDTLDPMTDCVMIANLVARSIGEGIGYEGMSTGFDPGVAKRTRLTRDLFERVCAQTVTKMRDVTEMFGK
jgi:putative nucleotidyltransferase with HDIG domain